MSHRKNQFTQDKYKDKCKRCGKCCIVWANGHWEDCRYLIKYVGASGKGFTTHCSIYQHRLYAIIGIKQFCNKRDRTSYNIPGCPYNKEGQKTQENYINE